MKIIVSLLTSLLSLLLLVNCPTASHGQTAVLYGDNPQAGAYITLNGVRHYYEAYGSGQPVLLIHGNRTPTKGWAAQLEYFSKKYRVYSVDSRGRGKSDLGPESLTFEHMAADMAAFITAMELDSVNVVGKSDGAIVAFLMGIRHPAHIRKIVAFAGNMQPDTTALYPETLTRIFKERREAEMMIAAKDTTKNWQVERQRLRLNEFQPHITAADLARIKMPVLVMSCDRDVIKLRHTLWIYEHIPLANLCILPGETHGLPKANPALFNQMADAFLASPFMPAEARFVY